MENKPEQIADHFELRRCERGFILIEQRYDAGIRGKIFAFDNIRQLAEFLNMYFTTEIIIDPSALAEAHHHG